MKIQLFRKIWFNLQEIISEKKINFTFLKVISKGKLPIVDILLSIYEYFVGPSCENIQNDLSVCATYVPCVKLILDNFNK